MSRTYICEIKPFKMICIKCGNKSDSSLCWKCKPKKPLKKTTLKKVSEKGKIKKEAKKEQFKDDVAFYDYIWHHRLHICEECEYEGKKSWLNEATINNFHHLLFKSKYPEFRYEPKNIVILCQDHHNSVHHGKLSEFIKQKTEQVKQLLL